MLRETILNTKTSTKLYTLFGCILGMFLVAVFFIFLPYYEQDLLKERRNSLADSVDVAYALVVEYNARAQKGEFPLDEAKKRAAMRLRTMRYGNNEYFWVNDTSTPSPIIIMHPTAPALEGKMVDNPKFNRATDYWLGRTGEVGLGTYPGGDKNLFTAFVDVCEKAGEGFVRYVWPKPLPGGGVSTEVYPKISYVRLYKPWNWIIGTGLYVDDIQAKVASLRIWLGAIMGGLVLLLSILVFLMVRIISRPIAKLSMVAGHIAGGDLNAKADESFFGEMGSLQQAMEQMVQTLRDKIGEAEKSTLMAEEEANVAKAAVAEADQAKLQAAQATREGLLQAAGKLRDVSQAIGDASRDLSQRIESSRRGSDLQKDRLNETATAMEEMNATVLTVAGNAGQAAEAANQAKHKAQDGAGVVNNLVQAIEDVYTQAQSLKTNMGQLGRQADGIGQVMGVINDIADQTNLLALNAAIEAARAGDAGRGFAVVADEVRKLAEKTMTATKEVARAISGIQQGTRENIKNVDLANERIEEATELAKESGESLSRIVSLVESSSSQVQSIAAASGEQSTASEEINRSLDDINRIASETSEAMNEAVEAVSGLLSQAQNLLALMRELENA
ncbi:MAG: methyl-accepting chemotaxis protein [Humidesulfovibrio sp.]|nr:methyl-accepting chemotaxis protein [Humidesulfovibrio sp.]